MRKIIAKALCILMVLAMLVPAFAISSDAQSFVSLTNNGTTVMSVNVNDSFDVEQAITYARVVCLKHSQGNNGTLIATCDQHIWVDGEQVWPIYRSANGGATWTHISDVKDTTYNTNRKAQPMLYELPVSVGNLSAGTLLLAGNLVPDNQSSSRLVVYKSTDVGQTWSLLSTVDVGGPFDYDPSPSSTTTTIWEPFLYMDDYGHLICAYSDERQKGNGVLQALSLRYTSDGINWSEQSNIVAIRNQNDRPGMVTVSKMPNGKYIATYEVVNKPSLSQNSSVVYFKFSEDGLNWNENDLGTMLQTEDCQHLGSSPFVKWVNAGGPNGMVVVGGKWVVDAAGDIQEGGQNLFVNYNYGEGNWERYPNAITWDGEDIIYLDAFSQCLETNIDDTILYQIANIGVPASRSSKLQIGVLPLTMDLYEAENANLSNVQLIDCEDSSGKQEVGYINYSNSSVAFNKIVVPTSGTYTVFVRYNNGSAATSRHAVTVNNSQQLFVSYAPTPNWHQYYWASFTCSLTAGTNSIVFSHDTGYAELDCIALYNPSTDLNKSFMVKNRNSNLFMEVPSMSTADGTAISQYEFTNYPCQVWSVGTVNNVVYFVNKNSNLALTIQNASASDGANAIQSTLTYGNHQLWEIDYTNNGYMHLLNRNSGKYLEVFNNLSSNGAAIGQWGPTNYACQEWALVREGIQ